MRIIDWHLETSMQGGEWNGTLEFEDDTTDEEISAAVREEVFNIASYGWTERPKS